VVVGGGDPRAVARASVAASKMRPWAGARPRLAARRAVSAERAAAHSTQCAPEMRLEPRIAPGGGRGGRWRRSARGRSRLGCGVEDAAMGRHSAAAGGSPCGLSRACRGAFDAVRARDAARAADRPRRRPWWSVAAIRARPLAPRLRRRRCGHGPTLGRITGGSPCGLSRACRGAFDAVRARDAARAADRPRRRPWWPWSVHGGAHSRKPSARVARPQTIIAKHIAPAPQPMPTPTHAHSVGGVESGCHRVPSCTQARSLPPPERG
jgi:hypothetical protein